ncbi:MAG: dienelactone hydrolase family protein [Armatimonadetes bacterium]|nr:dienelactone hydrolase family protein [Armatimonadota bacterium]
MVSVQSQNSCCADFAALGGNPAFVAFHESPKVINYRPQKGRMSKLEYGSQKADVFIVPPAEGSQAAVIMIHEWWGLNDHIKREAERLNAATGYGVAAIDLYGGRVAANRQDASRYMQEVEEETAREIVRAAADRIVRGELFGRNLPKVGTIGYCFGGGWSLQAALLGGSDVSACVVYYGMPETDAARLKSLRAPVLGIFAKRDGWINPQVVEQFGEAMKKAGKSLTVRSYDADHAFANPSNPNYDEENAGKAWKETLAFFKKHLG